MGEKQEKGTRWLSKSAHNALKRDPRKNPTITLETSRNYKPMKRGKEGKIRQNYRSKKTRKPRFRFLAARSPWGRSPINRSDCEDMEWKFI